jgi:hypothetical protein
LYNPLLGIIERLGPARNIKVISKYLVSLNIENIVCKEFSKVNPVLIINVIKFSLLASNSASGSGQLVLQVGPIL